MRFSWLHFLMAVVCATGVGCNAPPRDYGQIPAAMTALENARSGSADAVKSASDTVESIADVQALVAKRIADEDASWSGK